MALSGSEPRRPVIGLTTYLEQAKQGVWDVRAAFLPQQYFDAVTASGGIAVLLPPQPSPDAAADVVLDGLDGLILTGGLDVDPALYGAERHPTTDPARTDRDSWELALFRGAEARRVPVLAICRGLQLINVARGGTLHQHLPEALGTERYRIGGGVFATNAVTVDPGTRLAQLVGEQSLDVHSYHHQGIDRLGSGLIATARTDDGLVQAFESDGDGYVVGVQWHPEENVEDRRLFAGLVAEASVFAERRRSSSSSEQPSPARSSSERSETKRPQPARQVRA
ncbi:putative glutamine amidotransferase [Microbacterium terrae]|uniref:Glutamine amidotransferase n=1 Tax=Microbacterium terrae TaxID=69369 RepID=A0A0M2HEY6_9MICO|nr:gamma-glutamyl-gamma-aminobutyrate hydrolase family protein [Microbacterium terrae]KJL43281.1 putative glutamine amidotransferase [Microbacterium terrae]MBP1078515.1 putative glutamine amidotransferase [Microbacterium terrae]GLJ97915.1 gamma-glutamyl-gamma-aminobutyrate hydrolase [Microbacterium terrae]